MREVLLESREDKSQFYLPEKCIGCGTCVQVCPKGELIIGSVGAVARGLIDKDFIEKRKSGACVFCALCARVCPTGALEVRVAGKAEKDESYLSVALKPTVADEKCVHCGLCADVCPQACIELKDRRLAEDGSLKLAGQDAHRSEPLRALRLVRLGLPDGSHILREALCRRILQG